MQAIHLNPNFIFLGGALRDFTRCGYDLVNMSSANVVLLDVLKYRPNAIRRLHCQNSFSKIKNKLFLYMPDDCSDVVCCLVVKLRKSN